MVYLAGLIPAFFCTAGRDGVEICTNLAWVRLSRGLIRWLYRFSSLDWGGIVSRLRNETILIQWMRCATSTTVKVQVSVYYGWLFVKGDRWPGDFLLAFCDWKKTSCMPYVRSEHFVVTRVEMCQNSQWNTLIKQMIDKEQGAELWCDTCGLNTLISVTSGDSEHCCKLRVGEFAVSLLTLLAPWQLSHGLRG